MRSARVVFAAGSSAAGVAPDDNGRVAPEAITTRRTKTARPRMNTFLIVSMRSR